VAVEIDSRADRYVVEYEAVDYGTVVLEVAAQMFAGLELVDSQAADMEDVDIQVVDLSVGILHRTTVGWHIEASLAVVGGSRVVGAAIQGLHTVAAAVGPYSGCPSLHPSPDDGLS
jgi:hypothetical protein